MQTRMAIGETNVLEYVECKVVKALTGRNFFDRIGYMTVYEPNERLFSSDFAANIALDLAAIEAFCQRWDVVEIAFFGSVLKEDFGEESDIDVLISFGEDVTLGLLDKMAAREELEVMLGRNVDLVTKSGLSHWTTPPSIRDSILAEAEIVYAHA